MTLYGPGGTVEFRRHKIAQQARTSCNHGRGTEAGRRWFQSDLDEIVDVVQEELKGSGSLLGCRAMHQKRWVTLFSMSSLNLAQWIERPPGVREVKGSIPVADSDFSLSLVRVM